MSRPLRIAFPGAVYHVTSRGNEKNPIYTDDQDRRRFLQLLAQVNKRYNWICHAYCLMSNHFHLVIETPEGNLSLGMRQLNGVYTQYFNKAHNRTGHLLQGRYKAVLIQKESHLLEVCRYVVLNPVRAKMVEKPEEHLWSSYLAAAGKAKSHPCLHTAWVLSRFSRKRERAETEYQQFVSSGMGKRSIWSELRGQTILGGGDFVAKLADFLKKRQKVPELPRIQRYLNRPSLPELFSPEVRKNPARRRSATVKAVEKHGYLQREIADHLGIHYSTISRILKGER